MASRPGLFCGRPAHYLSFAWRLSDSGFSSGERTIFLGRPLGRPIPDSNISHLAIIAICFSVGRIAAPAARVVLERIRPASARPKTQEGHFSHSWPLHSGLYLHRLALWGSGIILDFTLVSSTGGILC